MALCGEGSSVLTKGDSDCYSFQEHKCWLKCWAQGPRMNQVLSEGPRAPGRGAESTAVGHSQAQRECNPPHSLCPGEILSFSPSRLGWLWGCISAHSPSTNLEEPSVSSLTPLFCRVWGTLSPHGRGPGSAGVLPLVPRCPWLVAVDGCRSEGGMEPHAGGARSPKK